MIAKAMPQAIRQYSIAVAAGLVVQEFRNKTPHHKLLSPSKTDSSADAPPK